MGTAYAAPISTSLPQHLEVRVVVMRKDEDDLTPEDIAAVTALYPPSAEQAVEVLGRSKAARAQNTAAATKTKVRTKRRVAAKRP